ncbi:TetR/AcrR family transcriptional regulator [Variovorax saccharolyticus]|uniref:TetR/AcrR family transcriptional regulator n=1 Tax=Variovorax saccharolyticus TaxID=3053516 RepID=UPI0025768705|nr:TetR/AcrR family transcriptional regulator [Variovorax sp. J22R187]MDM0016363.1 TetR/AcrR family transcriptional regulator [Variovorax sp. J22R187]
MIAANTLAGATTREQILRVARELIQTRSYLGFSFQDVADQVGIRKASLYHHFPTKEALGIEVLREATQAFKDWTAAKPRAPGAALESYFRMYRNGLHAGAGVCPAGALAPGWDCIDEDLRRAVRDLRNTQILWLGGVLGALMPAGEVGASAAYVFAACQGALLSARMTGQVEDFDEAIEQLNLSLAR